MFAIRFHIKLGKCLTVGKISELLVRQHLSLSLFLNKFVMGNLLKETSRNLNTHIDSGLAFCHLCQTKGSFAQPQEQSWNRNMTDRSPGAGLVFSICFFPPIQHSYLQYKYTTYSRKAASNSSLLPHTAVELFT